MEVVDFNVRIMYNLLMETFIDHFKDPRKILPCNKWDNYFSIYDKHLSRFRGTCPVILEIGVAQGGSVEMWNSYFDHDCKIYGVDIDPECMDIPDKLSATNINICMGDQGDREFWSKYLVDKPKFDIVIDDGGHTFQQQINTFECVYDHVTPNGVYLCEDTHTSYWNYTGYWSKEGGGYKKPGTFIEYSKNFVDALNIHHVKTFDKQVTKQELSPAEVEQMKRFRASTGGVTFYDSVVVLEKKPTPLSLPCQAFGEGKVRFNIDGSWVVSGGN